MIMIPTDHDHDPTDPDYELDRSRLIPIMLSTDPDHALDRFRS
jgi:hypothetical protein